MTPENYRRFTELLKERLSAEDPVLGLVALGSMASQDYLPDQWSDHDFFVIVRTGHQEFYRTTFNWLPDFQEIVFSFRETAHGVKVLYRDGHLLEFAVFDLDELYLARINRYRILLDRNNLEMHLQRIRQQTTEHSTKLDPAWLFGQFLTNLMVGVQRHYRGEKLSGHFFVKANAVKHLISLCSLYLNAPDKQLLDDLDSTRRFEFVFPEAGREINSILRLDTPEAAMEMLRFATKNFREKLPDFPSNAVETVANVLKNDKQFVLETCPEFVCRESVMITET